MGGVGWGSGDASQLNPGLEWSHHRLWHQNVKTSHFMDLFHCRSGSHSCGLLNTHPVKEKNDTSILRGRQFQGLEDPPNVPPPAHACQPGPHPATPTPPAPLCPTSPHLQHKHSQNPPGTHTSPCSSQATPAGAVGKRREQPVWLTRWVQRRGCPLTTPSKGI